jgi:hypothetical protein
MLAARGLLTVARIIIDTVRDHLREDYIVEVRCGHCDRSEPLNLQNFVESGLGDVSMTTLASRLRCRHCGKPGQLIRTPAR